MLVSLSSVAKLNCSTVDCGMRIRCEERTNKGAYIFHPNQLKAAGVGKRYISALKHPVVLGESGKQYKNHCVLSAKAVIASE